MFDLDPGDDLKLIVETARRLAASELAPKLRDSEAARAIDASTAAAWDEIGLAGLEVPERLGGAGLGCLARVLVNEELAAADAGAALALDPYGPALTTLVEVGGVDAAEQLVFSLEPEAQRACFVLAEDASLELDGDRLSLELAWAPVSHVGALVVLRGDHALLIREGIELTDVRGSGLRAAGAAQLRVARAPVAGVWSDAEGAQRARARARLYYASLLLGVMRASCDFAIDYSQQREAFGRPIGHHQALAFLLTDMRMALDAARLVVHEAAWRVERHLPCAAEAAGAWAECIEVSRSLGPNGVQVLGGHGFMADYPVEKHMREARALGLLCGGFDSAIEEAGQLLTASTSPLALGMEGAL